VKAPDFPTGGFICGTKGVVDAYTTGRGIITVRAKLHVETLKRGKTQIVVTEIPYQVGKQRIIDKIADLVKNDKIKSISALNDESDKKGMRLVIEVKAGEDPNVTINQLYKYTPLQDNFSIILLALAEGRPHTMTLKQVLEQFRDHRMDVIRRRTRYRLKRDLARLHIVDGLLIAQDNIDRVIELIRGSADRPSARLALQTELSLSERQAEAIVEMRLGALTGLERGKLEEERAKLIEAIADYRDILEKEQRVLAIIRDPWPTERTWRSARRAEFSICCNDGA
jgi:DNA gyrase subunit A